MIASLGGSLFITSYLAFLWGWWIPIVPTLIALFGSSTIITGYIALNVQETRRRAIISAIPDLMFNVSADGIYLGQLNYNRDIERIYSDFENIGKHISQFLMPESMIPMRTSGVTLGPPRCLEPVGRTVARYAPTNRRGLPSRFQS